MVSCEQALDPARESCVLNVPALRVHILQLAELQRWIKPGLRGPRDRQRALDDSVR